MKLLIGVIFGSCLNKENNNISIFESNVIPSIGVQIQLKNEKYRVMDVLIDYQMIQDVKEEDRGREIVFVFVKKI